MLLATCLGENNRRRGHKSRKAAEAEKSQPARALATPRRTVASAPLPRHRCAGRARKPRCVEFFIARFITLAGAISRARAVGRVSISRFDGSSVRGFDGSIIRSFECSNFRMFDSSILRRRRDLSRSAAIPPDSMIRRFAGSRVRRLLLATCLGEREREREREREQ